jgi:hypothetical protein
LGGITRDGGVLLGRPRTNVSPFGTAISVKATERGGIYGQSTTAESILDLEGVGGVSILEDGVCRTGYWSDVDTDRTTA